MINRLKALSYLIGDRKGTLEKVTAALIACTYPKRLKFVEIGVFKGDNAVKIIRLAKELKVKVYYFGFDLFEDQERFYTLHQKDCANYDTKENPYFEFASGQHALSKVKTKIAAVLDERYFTLIKGESTETVPRNIDKIRDADIIYIDGCYDYDIVSQDWKNVLSTFKLNPNLVVVFDDSTLEGVYKLKSEIEKDSLYKTQYLNPKQFFVVSNNLSWLHKLFFSVQHLSLAMLRLIKSFKTLLRHIRIKKYITIILGPKYKLDCNKIEIDITWDCNLNCIDCNRLCGWGRTGEFMSVEQIKKFIKESIDQNRKWKDIRVLGGEPTLHPHIFDILDLLLSYKRNFSRDTRIVLCTNGFGLQVNNVLSKITGEIEIENTKKTSIVQEAFVSFTIAPADDPLRYKDVDYSNGCWIISGCGIGLTRYGYYPCAVGGAIDRFLGYNIGRNSLPPYNDLMQDHLRILCKYCGHFKRTNNKSEGKIFPTWQKIYEEYKRKKPTLTLY